MDNLTHSLVGLAAAKAGLDRLSPYTTPLSVLAANAPDADIIAALWGPSAYLEHHRGITHSIIGTLLIALTLPLLFYGGDRLAARLGKRPPSAKLGGLTLASLITCATHPLLDWTNNYGVRPLLPWEGRWFYGDLVFVIDPWLWLSLGGACFLLTEGGRWSRLAWAGLALLLTIGLALLPARAGFDYPAVSLALWVAGLAGLAVAASFRLGQHWGRPLALLALVAIVVYWGALSLLQGVALRKVEAFARETGRQDRAATTRYAAMPTFGNPWRWLAVVETNAATYRYHFKLNGAEPPPPATGVERFERPAGSEADAVRMAAADDRAKIFLGFARFPAVSVQRNCAAEILVRFADLRYTEPGARRNDNFTVEVNLGPQPPQQNGGTE